MAKRIESEPTTRPGNRLGFEKSPYLLQHAHNPVDWYPWGLEAFEKAREQDKPVFLSIGYSTCHWCHVMEHESFEDPEVAWLMNDTFVCIKVDREERPDIDSLYMTACQGMTGGGGWPLTIIMTPDQKPFFAGTYIPKENRFGRLGMLELIPRIKELWATRRSDVLRSADEITHALKRPPRRASDQDPDASVLDLAFRQLGLSFDPRRGGFGGAPKFPTPHNLTFLLRHWSRTKDPRALTMVEKTLEAMRHGGVYDQIGFGFHRYSTDDRWLVPHFEKMLYDQALLAIAYLEAHQATGKSVYADTAREIFTYVLRDMTDPCGGFHSAEDADSEGEEGRFYLWTEAEIRQVLSEDEADLAIKVFGVEPEGNYVDPVGGPSGGKNIVYLAAPPTEPGVKDRLEAVRQKLLAHRATRGRPHKDDKILTDWNGLMIVALAKGARVLDEPRYAQAASRAADFILNTLRTPEGRLLHRYRDGQAGIAAHLDDYAFFIWGLIDLYEATFDTRRLQTALNLNRDALTHFWDERSGGFYLTASDGEELLVRQKDSRDGAVPSGNSVAMLNLLRLGRMTANPDLEVKAARLGRAFSEGIERMPMAHTQMLIAVDFAVGPSQEVVIAGDPQADDTKAMLRALRSRYLPNTVLLMRSGAESTPAIVDWARFTLDLRPIGAKATAYVCKDHRCDLPTSDPDRMLDLLAIR